MSLVLGSLITVPVGVMDASDSAPLSDLRPGVGLGEIDPI